MKKKISDLFARSMTKFFRFIADTFFAKRYGHRAVVLETVAGVPGMVAGVWLHAKSLRKMKTGWGPKIREMMEEAENERMHLMIFIDIAKPTWLERWIVLFAQLIFILFYTFLYIFFPKTAHRMIHYFEEEAVVSYTQYLHMIKSGQTEDIDAPEIAIEYYNLKKNAKLSDVIVKVRADEEKHAKVNYEYSL
jgi:ubiquinol oxidase|tara:strand:+ start:16321 stop:16896 length:576 start_codon:yes stop_codon:yes gene_type:complete